MLRDDTTVVVKPVIDLNDHVHVTQYEVPDRMQEASVLSDVDVCSRSSTCAWAAAVGELARRQQTLDLTLTDDDTGTDGGRSGRGGGRGNSRRTHTCPSPPCRATPWGSPGRWEHPVADHRRTGPRLVR